MVGKSHYEQEKAPDLREIAELRERARRARVIAWQLSDRQAARRLMRDGEELEMRADALEAKYIGGLLGYDVPTKHSNTSAYWDTDTSGVTNLSQGAGNIRNDKGITGMTTKQLQSGLPTGFDPKIWGEDSSINNGLPYLIANPPPK